LIRPFATGRTKELATQHRLARPRKTRTADDQVGVDRTENKYFGAHYWFDPISG
jgi:hypothetical protein